jgi:hypothetical protein
MPAFLFLLTILSPPASPQAWTLDRFLGGDGNNRFASADLDDNFVVHCSRDNLRAFPLKAFRARIFISKKILGKSGPIFHALRRKKTNHWF